MEKSDIYSVLRIINDLISNKKILWRLEGSANLFLQGVDVSVRDIDITTNENGIKIFKEALKEFVEKDYYDADKKMKTLLSNINGFEVEINCYNRKELEMLDKFTEINWNGLTLPVLPLENALKFYKIIKRDEKVKLIEEYLRQRREDLTRAFICIELNDEGFKEVARVQELLGKRIFTGKMTELENLHLTLKFLGEIVNDKLERVKKRLEKIKFREFEAKFGEMGIFNSYGNPRIVWIKINGKEIWNLQKKIDEILGEEGFVNEERFMSHMTIARIKYVKNKEEFLENIKNIKVKEIKLKIKEFKLKSSELRSSGPVYKDIGIYRVIE